MTLPQRAISAVFCVLTALALGLVARLPGIVDRLDAADRGLSVDILLGGADAPASREAEGWVTQ